MSEQIINRHGLEWHVVDGDDSKLIDAAITHAAVTGSTGCTYGEEGGESVTVERLPKTATNHPE